MENTQTHTSLADHVISLGFKSEGEFHEMIAAVDCSSPLKMQVFKTWQLKDGTKLGLQRVLIICGDRRQPTAT